ncbi:NUDIX domain-containing protein [Rhizomonospora bruguierae]|uniref:NUDIX domain-containing protein n=1 Tax=Rhizomonospora bruguierae TaxID=1581705 RepID=UPI001BCB8FB9|nr:NUDIX domain-containing protein [Micromonospora sp. NBRC 107566]
MTALNTTTIRAAGGVVYRDAPGAGGVEVCLVHRPRYDDWSLPKGKVEQGEHPLVAAVREVGEEAGLVATPQVRLPRVHYAVGGAPKVVDYWSMRAVEPAPFEPNEEADDLCWLPAAAAIERVSYPHDREVLRAFANLPPVTGVVLLVRHAHAGRRESWFADDGARPLEPAGEVEAARLVSPLAACRPRRLLSATPRRCRQTLAPLAAALDLPIEADGRFDETVNDAEGSTAVAALPTVAALPPTVVCSQGKVIPPALARLVEAAGGPQRPAARYRTAKGSGWLLAFGGNRLVGLDPLDADPLDTDPLSADPLAG